MIGFFYVALVCGYSPDSCAGVMARGLIAVSGNARCTGYWLWVYKHCRSERKVDIVVATARGWPADLEHFERLIVHYRGNKTPCKEVVRDLILNPPEWVTEATWREWVSRVANSYNAVWLERVANQPGTFSEQRTQFVLGEMAKVRKLEYSNIFDPRFVLD